MEKVFYTVYLKLILCLCPSSRFNCKTAKSVFIKFGAGFNI
jgi:hypothetical protein